MSNKWLDKYVIIETITGIEYKIAIPSYQYVSDTPLYMCLAEIYRLQPAVVEGVRQERVNRFATFVEAEKAIGELLSREIEHTEEI